MEGGVFICHPDRHRVDVDRDNPVIMVQSRQNAGYSHPAPKLKKKFLRSEGKMGGENVRALEVFRRENLRMSTEGKAADFNGIEILFGLASSQVLASVIKFSLIIQMPYPS